jgi:hypothetical protein
VVHTTGRVFTDVGMQLLCLCEQPKFVDIAVMLVESKSIDVNMDILFEGRKANPLFLACMKGRLPVVQALVQAGADREKGTDIGTTPLEMAEMRGYADIVHFLKSAVTSAPSPDPVPNDVQALLTLKGWLTSGRSPFW